MGLGLISYFSAAFCFTLLAILLVTVWRGRFSGILIVVAVAVSAVWAIFAAYTGLGTYLSAIGYYSFEVLRNLVWFAVLYRIIDPLRDSKHRHIGILRYATPIVIIASLLLLLIELFTVFFALDVLIEQLEYVSIAGHLVMAIVGLVLVEQVFRNTKPDQRWPIKPLLFAIGGMFAYDFFLYADALLFGRIDSASWEARGFINAIIVPMIGMTAVRNHDWSLDIFISRRVVFHTASLVGAGVYMIVMAIFGYYIRGYGGTWGAAAQVVFLFLSMLLLFILLFSGQMRAKLRVFLDKHFFNYRYDYRDEWLKLSDVLITSGNRKELYENAIKALANLVDSTGGGLWVRKEGGHYINSASWNMPRQSLGDIRDDSSLVQFLSRTKWVIDLEEYELSPEVYEGLEIYEWTKQMEDVWLIIPLIQKDQILAFVILMMPRVDRQINWEDRDLLKTVGMQLASQIALLETTEQLTDARQFEAFNRLSSYIVHDLKNLSAQLSLILSNAEKHKRNPDFVDDMLETVGNVVFKMDRMLGQLRKKNAEKVLSVKTDIDKLVTEVVRVRSVDQPVPSYTNECGDIHLYIDGDRLANVLTHIVQNAQQASSIDGCVSVSLSCTEDKMIIEVSDNGCGMDQAFIRERLFRPFDTTKGNAGMGIGVYESREFVWSQGGDLAVDSEVGVGTTFRIILPLINNEHKEGHIMSDLGVVN